jgi:hypothetical protein
VIITILIFLNSDSVLLCLFVTFFVLPSRFWMIYGCNLRILTVVFRTRMIYQHRFRISRAHRVTWPFEYGRHFCLKLLVIFGCLSCRVQRVPSANPPLLVSRSVLCVRASLRSSRRGRWGPSEHVFRTNFRGDFEKNGRNGRHFSALGYGSVA